MIKYRADSEVLDADAYGLEIRFERLDRRDRTGEWRVDRQRAGRLSAAHDSKRERSAREHFPEHGNPSTGPACPGNPAGPAEVATVDCIFIRAA